MVTLPIKNIFKQYNQFLNTYCVYSNFFCIIISWYLNFRHYEAGHSSSSSSWRCEAYIRPDLRGDPRGPQGKHTIFHIFWKDYQNLTKSIIWKFFWLFEGRLRQCKNVLPDGLNWQCYFAGSSKSLCEKSISSIYLESHQVDMKNVVKSSKHFFGYLNTLKTHSDSRLR